MNEPQIVNVERRCSGANTSKIRPRRCCAGGAAARARNTGDSGNPGKAMSRKNSGRTAPRTKTARQPKRSMTVAATAAPSSPPSGTPTITTATATVRHFGGVHSAVSVVAIGVAPPRPRPVRTRNQNSAARLGVAALASEPMDSSAMQVSSARLRPAVSASHPNAIEPNAIPTILAPSTGAIASGLTLKAPVSTGATSAADCRSYPSVVMIRKPRIVTQTAIPAVGPGADDSLTGCCMSRARPNP